MTYGRRSCLVLLGIVLCLQPAIGARGKLDEQQKQKLLDEAKQFHAQALKLDQAGQYARAVPLGQKSLAIRKEVLGSRHPAVAQSLNNLAVLYEHMGQYAKAEPLHV